MIHRSAGKSDGKTDRSAQAVSFADAPSGGPGGEGPGFKDSTASDSSTDIAQLMPTPPRGGRRGKTQSAFFDSFANFFSVFSFVSFFSGSEALGFSDSAFLM